MVLDETENNGVLEHVVQMVVEQAIWNDTHHKHFHLAEHAPICQGPMQDAFGYLATTVSARQVLAGAYAYLLDFDQVTRELCESCARIRLGVPADLVDTMIQHGEWSGRWGKASKKTSLSESGLHFGHHKVLARLPFVSHLHTLKTTLALKRVLHWTGGSEGFLICWRRYMGAPKSVNYAPFC